VRDFVHRALEEDLQWGEGVTSRATLPGMALQPEVLILDEAVSALDVLVQNQIIQLLANLQEEFRLSYLFITHDLAVVRQTADDIVVMEKGRIVGKGTADSIFDSPQETYTKELIAAVPGLNIELGTGDHLGIDIR